MSIEAVTKYAINSSLGTEDFMPLNQMLETRLVAVSDYVFSTIRWDAVSPSRNSNGDYIINLPVNLVFSCSGAVFFDFSYVKMTTNQTVVIRCFDNGALKKEESKTSTSNTDRNFFTLGVGIQKNNNYTFEINLGSDEQAAQATASSLKSLSINAFPIISLARVKNTYVGE